MKSFTVLSFGAALAAAQSFSDLAPCGQLCINNMMALAPSLGCDASDIACLCNTPDYGYGIRDCSNQVCTDAQQAQQAISYGALNCASASSAASAGGSSTAGSASSSGSASGFQTASGSGGAMTGSATATLPLVAVITSDGSTITSTTGSTTLYAGASGAASSLSASASSAASSLESGASSLASSITDAAGSASSSLASEASSATSEAGASSSAASGGDQTTTTDGGAAMITAAPALGLGLAALAVFAL